MGNKVVVLDYGFGNIRSAQRALQRAGADAEVTADFDAAMNADGLVVPGVGAFAACMAGLRKVRGNMIIGRRLAGFYEGCLSVPGLAALVARHRAVRVEALDERGEPVDRVLRGWSARIVQHEADHLGGRLYLDRAEPRSLSTADNYVKFWAGHPPADAADALGFTLR